MKRRLLMFGRSGQVATEIRRRAGERYAVKALGRAEADLRDPAICASRINEFPADIVVNAAAWTAVDAAEANEPEAALINGAAPAAMAAAAAARGIPFLHISTDYVFDGMSSTPRRETDPVVPVNAYGRTKLAGERGIVAAGGEHVILRTAWVYSAHGQNFLKTMLRVGRERDMLRVVDDQHGDPTPAQSIADALITIADAFAERQGIPGIFNFSGTPTVSWYGFACEILEKAAAMEVVPSLPRIEPIGSAEWPTPAARPTFSSLDCTRIATCYGVAQPDWRRSLDEIIAAVGANAPR
jgi:dTDP-4-dehydrorhamnose reductase